MWAARRARKPVPELQGAEPWASQNNCIGTQMEPRGGEVLGDCWIGFGILKEVGTWVWGWVVVHCGGYHRKKRGAEWWVDWRRGRSLSVLLQLPSIKASEAASDVARSLEAVLLRRDHCEKMRLRPEEIFCRRDSTDELSDTEFEFEQTGVDDVDFLKFIDPNVEYGGDEGGGCDGVE
nr:uncharacterized protein LOC109159120 [Ipomoea batatas]